MHKASRMVIQFHHDFSPCLICPGPWRMLWVCVAALRATFCISIVLILICSMQICMLSQVSDRLDSLSFFSTSSGSSS